MRRFGRSRTGTLSGGVDDKTHNIVGTTVRPAQQRVGMNELENWLVQMLMPRVDLRFHPPFDVDGKTVVILEIPAATSQPVRFQHVAHIRVGGIKRPLRDFPDKERRLWHLREDWSAQVVDGATFGDLDEAALVFARAQYRKKHAAITDEPSWNAATFLNKAKVCVNNKVTRTALLLLGKPDSAHLLSPALAHVTWVLKGADGVDRDYRHFSAPLILVGDALLQRIRNLTLRHLPQGTLFPEEVTQYDEWVIRETLHNCIAHQDYTAGARITVVENEDSLTFTNRGSFIPGTVEEMIAADAPPDVYRNPFLANAMVNLNMIDTIGSGIKRMFRVQRERSLPLPDYDLADPDKVVVRLSGRIIDENFTRLLLANDDMELTDVIALDKVQKKKPISEEDASRLRKRGLIEGKRPNLHVSAKIAAATGAKASFIKNRTFDKAHYRKLIVAYLEKFDEAALADFRTLLMDKLSDSLTEAQKHDFISNLLQDMRRDGVIVPHGERRWAKWRLTSPHAKGGS